MKRFSTLARLWVLASLLTAGVAQAAALTAADPTQLGRLSRNNVAQTWDPAGTEPYPGAINPTLSYHYRTFSFNVGLNNYVQFDLDTISPNIFFSAYQTNYNPLNLAQNWLGDAGSSANFAFDANPAGGADPRFFQIIAAINSVVVLVVNETTPNLGLGATFTALAELYPDSGFNFDPVIVTPFATVAVIPEPSTMLLLLAPLALVAVRRKRSASAMPMAMAA